MAGGLTYLGVVWEYGTIMASKLRWVSHHVPFLRSPMYHHVAPRWYPEVISSCKTRLGIWWYMYFVCEIKQLRAVFLGHGLLYTMIFQLFPPIAVVGKSPTWREVPWSLTKSHKWPTLRLPVPHFGPTIVPLISLAHYQWLSQISVHAPWTLG